MKLNHSEQQQFISMLNGDKMNEDKTTNDIVASIGLSFAAFAIKITGLIYCIKWAFGVNVTAKEAVLALLIGGLFVPIEPNKGKSEIFNFCVVAIARILLCLIVYVVAHYF